MQGDRFLQEKNRDHLGGGVAGKGEAAEILDVFAQDGKNRIPVMVKKTVVDFFLDKAFPVRLDDLELLHHAVAVKMRLDGGKLQSDMPGVAMRRLTAARGGAGQAVGGFEAITKTQVHAGAPTLRR